MPTTPSILTLLLFPPFNKTNYKKTEAQVSFILLSNGRSAQGLRPGVREFFRSSRASRGHQVQHLGATQRPQDSSLRHRHGSRGSQSGRWVESVCFFFFIFLPEFPPDKIFVMISGDDSLLLKLYPDWRSKKVSKRMCYKQVWVIAFYHQNVLASAYL